MGPWFPYASSKLFNRFGTLDKSHKQYQQEIMALSGKAPIEAGGGASGDSKSASSITKKLQEIEAEKKLLVFHTFF
jgi:hypothetical protein